MFVYGIEVSGLGPLFRPHTFSKASFLTLKNKFIRSFHCSGTCFQLIKNEWNGIWELRTILLCRKFMHQHMWCNLTLVPCNRGQSVLDKTNVTFQSFHLKSDIFWGTTFSCSYLFLKPRVGAPYSCRHCSTVTHTITV